MREKDIQSVFEQAATTNVWGDADSRSGPGSNLEQTAVIRERIPSLLVKYHIRSMIDAPCGDFFWMKEIIENITASGVKYTGADIVKSLIDSNSEKYKNSNVQFIQVNLIEKVLPPCDLVMTRDCFIHLSFENIYSILSNYKMSGVKYVLVSTYENSERKNTDVPGFFLPGRALNMQKFPFSFGRPVELINEGCTEGGGAYKDKSLGMWEVQDLPLHRMRLNLLWLHQRNKIIKLYRRVHNKLRSILSRK